ncbi:MAG: hypothetical protein ACLR6J_17675 [Parabacteroides merdae]
MARKTSVFYPSRTPSEPDDYREVGTTSTMSAWTSGILAESPELGNRRFLSQTNQHADLPVMLLCLKSPVSTLPRENLGEMKNRGFESLVSWQDKIGEVEYGASLNMTYARNEITFWDEVQNVPEYQFSTGRPVGSRNMLLYVADGIFHTQAEIDEARAKGLLYSDNTVPGDIRFKDI